MITSAWSLSGRDKLQEGYEGEDVILKSSRAGGAIDVWKIR